MRQPVRRRPAPAGRRAPLPGQPTLPGIRPAGRRVAFGRAGLLAALLGLAAPGAAGQQLLDFQYADSLTQALLDQHRYRALDSVGRAALALGTDYPALRRRLGAGALATDHPAAALRYYGPTYRANPADPLARVGLALASLALNRPGPAALLAYPLPDSLRRALHLPGPTALASLEAEASVLPTAERRRGTATYGRLGLSSRLGSRLLLSHDVSYYRQAVEQPAAGSPGAVEQRLIGQGQYHGLLAAQLGLRWQARAGATLIAYDGPHYLGYLALAYAAPRWTAQAGFYAGSLTDTARTQADLRLTVYPLGNLRLYGFGRGSLVGSGGRTYPNGTLGAGGRLRPWLWAETWASGGLVPVLADLDGLYVYNLLDPLRRRTAASLLILARRRWLLRLTYGAEVRRISRLRLDYTLHSLTVSFTHPW